MAGRRSDPLSFGLLAMGLGGVLAAPFVLRLKGTAALRVPATASPGSRAPVAVRSG